MVDGGWLMDQSEEKQKLGKLKAEIPVVGRRTAEGGAASHGRLAVRVAGG